jgi:hypothetical protein
VSTFPTNWQQRSSASSDTSQFFSGTKSLKLTGAASSIYVNYTGNLVPSLEGSTDYFINARVKASTIQTPGSSFVRLRFIDITNGSAQTNTLNINTTASYWKYVTMKLTTASSTSSVRLDILHTLESGDAVYVDDIEFYKVSNHSQTISLPAKNDSTSPTGNITGPTTTTSFSPSLQLSGTDNFDSSSYLQMQLSENSDFSGADWQWYSASPTFNLSAGLGSKTVYLRFRDVHQNISSTYSLGLTVTQESSNNSSSSSSNSSSSSSSGPTVTSCNSPAPGIADLFQIDATNTQATLYITKPQGNVNKFLISYGYGADTKQFNTTVSINPSVWIDSVTIKNLAPNTTYFFKANAINDCTPGADSKVLQAKTTSNQKSINKSFKSSNIIQRKNSNNLNPQSTVPTPSGTQKVTVSSTQPTTNTPQNLPSANTPQSAPAISSTPAPQPTQSWLGGIVTSIKKMFGF